MSIPLWALMPMVRPPDADVLGGPPGEKQHERLVAVEPVGGRQVNGCLVDGAGDAYLNRVLVLRSVGQEIGGVDGELGGIARGQRFGWNEGDVVYVGRDVKIAA